MKFQKEVMAKTIASIDVKECRDDINCIKYVCETRFVDVVYKNQEEHQKLSTMLLSWLLSRGVGEEGSGRVVANEYKMINRLCDVFDKQLEILGFLMQLTGGAPVRFEDLSRVSVKNTYARRRGKKGGGKVKGRGKRKK